MKGINLDIFHYISICGKSKPGGRKYILNTGYTGEKRIYLATDIPSTVEALKRE